MFSKIKVVDSCWTFSTELSDTFRSCFVYGKSKDHEKNYMITVQKKFTFLRTLNARKSCADSFLKIKIDDNRARFSRNQQNSEKFDSET